MQTLERELGLGVPAALTLVARGLHTADEARAFLEASPSDLSDPATLPDAAAAVDRLRRALDGEHLRIFGDYDCDGITATALAVGVLRRLGANVDYRIPSRLREGYGLSRAAVEAAAADGVDLLVTVDCGVAATDEIALARSLGMDVIVTDHHEPGAGLPGAVAVVGPKRADSEYPYRDLSGVGVVYQLLGLLAEDDLSRELDLVALGTVADAAPLTGDNRLLVRGGLDVIRQRPRQAFASLATAGGFELDGVDATTLAMVLGPRINAPGRLGNAAGLVELLLTREPARADRIAAGCERANAERRRLQEELATAVEAMAAADPDFETRGFLLLWDPGWHPGILGPAASRVAETFRRPAALLAAAPDEPGIFRGSARSVGDYDVLGALRSCGDLLEGYGGHRAAAGLSVSRDNLEVLADRLDARAREDLPAKEVLPSLEVLGELPLASLDRDSVLEMESLGPFGSGNPRPVFLARDVEIKRARPAGAERRHLILELAGRGTEAIGFNLGPLWQSLDDRRRVDLAFTPEVDRWRGRERVRLRLESLRPAGEGVEGSVLAALRGRYRDLAAGNPDPADLESVLGWLGCRSADPEGAGGFFDPAGEEGTRLLEELEMDRPALERVLTLLSELGAVAPMQRGDHRVWIVLPGSGEPLDFGGSLRYRRERERLEEIRRAARAPGAIEPPELARLLYGFRPGGDSPAAAGVSRGSGAGKGRR